MIDVRVLHRHEEFEAAVDLQRRIWGFAEVEVIPVRMFVVASRIGGQVFGAFDGEELVGFCVSLPGLKPGIMYLHSHMLGVLPEYRDKGAGRLLKLAQREEALSRGIGLVEWTFDPLEIKNAYFNIERLGAIVRRYVLNQYGNTSSHLHGALPTDRCVAEWWLNSSRVIQKLNASESALMMAPSSEGRVCIEVPSDIGRLRREDPKLAREIQARISDAFLEHFEQGLVVIRLERRPEKAVYWLAEWDF
jgi:predicted GNAT superfamily acetyltransferase